MLYQIICLMYDRVPYKCGIRGFLFERVTIDTGKCELKNFLNMLLSFRFLFLLVVQACNLGFKLNIYLIKTYIF